MNRCGIYFFYDPDGIVDEYVYKFLDEINKHLQKLVFVVNGTLGSYDRKRLGLIPGISIIVRENVGFDVWAYKESIEAIGWEAITKFDEVIMMNFTIAGPVNSFATMFDLMDCKDIDFWGITVHHGADHNPWDEMPNSKIPLHLQSHFIAVRNNMLCSPEFRRYWDNLPKIESYWDSVSKHEVLFTKRFAEYGFRWTSYVDTSDLEQKYSYPLFNDPVELIDRRDCPIFKRKSFISGLSNYFGETTAGIARDLWEYLVASGKYDMNLLLENLVRTSSLDVIEETCTQVYVIEESSHSVDIPRSQVCLAVIDPDSLQLHRICSKAAETGIGTVFVYQTQALGKLHYFADSEAVLGVEVIEAIDAIELLRYMLEFPLSVVVCTPSESQPFRFGIQEGRLQEVMGTLAHSRSSLSSLLALFMDQNLGVLGTEPSLHGTYYGKVQAIWDDESNPIAEIASILDINPVFGQKKPMLGSDSFVVRNSVLRAFLPSALNPESISRLNDALNSVFMLRLFGPLTAIVSKSIGKRSARVTTTSIAARHLALYGYYLGELNHTLGPFGAIDFETARFRIMQLSEAERQLEKVLGSRSWRLTAPLRAIVGIVRRKV